MRFAPGSAIVVLVGALLTVPQARGCYDYEPIVQELKQQRPKASRPVSPPWAPGRLGPVRELRWQYDRLACRRNVCRIESALRSSMGGEEMTSLLADPDGKGGPVSSVRIPLAFLKALGRHTWGDLSTDPGMGKGSGENYVLVLGGSWSPTVACLVHGGGDVWRWARRAEVSPRSELRALGVTGDLLDAAWPHQPWGPNGWEVVYFLSLCVPTLLMGCVAYPLTGFRESCRLARRSTLLLLAGMAVCVAASLLRRDLWTFALPLAVPAGFAGGILATASLAGLLRGLSICVRRARIPLGARLGEDKPARAAMLDQIAGRRRALGIVCMTGTTAALLGAPFVDSVGLSAAAVAAGLFVQSRRLALRALREDPAVPPTCGIGTAWLLALPALLVFFLESAGTVPCSLGLALGLGALATVRIDDRLRESLESGYAGPVEAPPASRGCEKKGAGPVSMCGAPVSGRCAVCGSHEGDPRWVSCPGCGTPHHASCWEYSGACGIYGCGAPTAPGRGSRSAVREKLVIR